MKELDQKALNNLRSLAGGQSQAREIGKQVAFASGDVVGQTYKETLITGDSSGTQIVVGADPRRIAFVLSGASAQITIALDAPVTQGNGLNVFLQQTQVILHKRDFGKTVTMQWFGYITAATVCYVLEILQ